jgi:zinc transport system substrate-binding protein
MKNYSGLQKDLQELDRYMGETAAKLPDVAVFGSHPVYQYLGLGYNMEIREEHWEPGEMPSDKQWKAFKHNLEHHPANLMLWEGSPMEEIEMKLQDYKVQSVVFNPCGNQPTQGDFISVMRDNIRRLEKYIDEFC